MNWTTEKPTKPGLYWALHGPLVVAIFLHSENKSLKAFRLSSDLPEPLDHFTHFMGPLQTPEPPKDTDL